APRVVTRAVAEARQGVVLGEDPDPRAGSVAAFETPGSAAPEPAADGCRQASGRMLDLEPVAGDGLGDPAGRLVLLERPLRMRVDPVAELEDLGPGVLHGAGEAPLRSEEHTS